MFEVLVESEEVIFNLKPPNRYESSSIFIILLSQEVEN